MNTLSQEVRARGIPSVAAVTALTGTSRQSLDNWYKNKPRLFDIVMRGCQSALSDPNVRRWCIIYLDLHQRGQATAFVTGRDRKEAVRAFEERAIPHGRILEIKDVGRAG